MLRNSTPALRLETGPTHIKTLADLAKFLGLQPQQGREAESIAALVTALKAERDSLKEKLAEQGTAHNKPSDTQVVVAASRRSSDADSKLVKSMIGDTTGVEI